MDSGDSCVLEPRSAGRGMKEGCGATIYIIANPGHRPHTLQTPLPTNIPHSPLPRTCPSPNTILHSPGFTAP